MPPKKFTLEAELIWRALPKRFRDEVLLAVWCKKCGTGAPMCETFGVVKKGDLVLKGRCGFCISRVTLVLETAELRFPFN